MAVPVRVWIGVLLLLTTYVNFSTRGNLSVSIVSMVTKEDASKLPECLEQDKKEDTGPNATTAAPPPLPNYGPRYDWDQPLQAKLLGIYFAGLVISSIVAGTLLEMMGPFRAIFWMHVIQMVLNALCVPATWCHYSLLMVCRFLLGLTGGLVTPALHSLLARWAPPAEKGKFVSCLLGNSLGTCLIWPIVGFLTHHFGWDWGFYFLSIQIGVFCIIFYFVASDDPTNHPWITEEEKNYILESQAGTVSKTKSAPPYKAIFKSIPFWGLVSIHVGNMWGLYLQMTGVPKFIAEVIGFDLKDSGVLAALPPLSRLFCGLGYGALGDYLKKKNVPIKFTRKFFVLFSHIIPGVILAVITFFGCNWIIVLVLLITSLAVNGAAVLTNLQNNQDLSPNFAGTLFALSEIMGGCAGVLSPALTGWLIKDNNGMKEWGMNFMVGGAIYIGTGLIFIIIGSVELQPWNEKKEG